MLAGFLFPSPIVPQTNPFLKLFQHNFLQTPTFFRLNSHILIGVRVVSTVVSFEVKLILKAIRGNLTFSLFFHLLFSHMSCKQLETFILRLLGKFLFHLRVLAGKHSGVTPLWIKDRLVGRVGLAFNLNSFNLNLAESLFSECV